MIILSSVLENSNICNTNITDFMSYSDEHNLALPRYCGFDTTVPKSTDKWEDSTTINAIFQLIQHGSKRLK